jgi:hypothetical protein
MKLSVALAFLLTVEDVRAFSLAPPSRSVSKIPTRTTAGKLFGILDEINGDEYDLMSSTPDESDGLNDSFEMFLGDLVFSTNDPRVDIMNDYERATDMQFLTWMKNKVDNSKDPEERLALKDLYEMIVDVKKRVEISNLGKERVAKEAEEKEEERMKQAEADADAGLQMSNTDILRKAAAISSAKSAEDFEEVKQKSSFYDTELTPEIRMSYDDYLKELLPPYKAGETPFTVATANYEKFDAQFVKVLTERATNGDLDSVVLLEALAEEQGKRITAATEALKNVLSMGEPMKMEGAIVRLAREGKIDESFLLLLEANETQARDAGAVGPAELMKRLRRRAAEEKDKQMSSKEIRLIRKLLRAENSQEREKILEDAFTPRDTLLVSYIQGSYRLFRWILSLITLNCNRSQAPQKMQ